MTTTGTGRSVTCSAEKLSSELDLDPESSEGTTTHRRGVDCCTRASHLHGWSRFIAISEPPVNLRQFYSQTAFTNCRHCMFASVVSTCACPARGPSKYGQSHDVLQYTRHVLTDHSVQKKVLVSSQRWSHFRLLLLPPERSEFQLSRHANWRCYRHASRYETI